MNYTISILKNDIDKLESVYMKTVINGTVSNDNAYAIINRRRVDELRQAVSILEKNMQ
jgi:hypothetical protein